MKALERLLEREGLPSFVNLPRTEGLQVILTEGGPTLIGQLIAENLVDEIFLTTATLYRKLKSYGLINGSRTTAKSD